MSWKRVILTKDTECADCGCTLRAGTKAFGEELPYCPACAWNGKRDPHNPAHWPRREPTPQQNEYLDRLLVEYMNECFGRSECEFCTRYREAGTCDQYPKQIPLDIFCNVVACIHRREVSRKERHRRTYHPDHW